MVGAFAMRGGDEKRRQNIGPEPQEKKLLRIGMHRKDNNIKLDLKEIGLGGVDCIELAQDTDQWWAIVNFLVP
jgi:hypothetical protein